MRTPTHRLLQWTTTGSSPRTAKRKRWKSMRARGIHPAGLLASRLRCRRRDVLVCALKLNGIWLDL